MDCDVDSDEKSHCSPIGRDNGLKIRPVWVRVPPVTLLISDKREPAWIGKPNGIRGF